MHLLVAYLLGILSATKTLKEPRDSSNGHQGAADQGNTSHVIARAKPEIPPAVINDGKTNDTQKQWWPRNFKEWAEVFGVFVLLIYTGTTIALWCAAREANRGSERSREASEKSVHLDQRAWIAVSDVSPGDEKKSPWEISIVFKNTGRTPAKNFAVELAGEPVAKGASPTAKEDAYPGLGS